MKPGLAIDFGTANLRVVSRDGGIVFDEPSVCCFERSGGAPAMFAAGRDAKPMVGRTPPRLQIRSPLVRGVLQDPGAAKGLLAYAISKALGRRPLRRPDAIMGVPADATQAEREGLLAAGRDAGLGKIQLAAEPLAAARGAGLAVDAPGGLMIVDCGAGVTEVAVVTLGGIARMRSVRAGGADLDQAIADHLHARHRMLIGDGSAEALKQRYAALSPGGGQRLPIKGRSLNTGAPVTVEVEAEACDQVARKLAGGVAEAVLAVLADTPPELVADIHSHGIVLTGGAAIPAMGHVISEAAGVPVLSAPEPERCVAKGLHKMLMN